MKFFATLSLAIALPTFAADPRGDHPDSKPSTPAEQRAMFHLPPGFEIQLVAAEPEIQKPLNLTFDAAGRLWVTGSEMYPWPASTDAQGKPIPDFAKAYDDIADAFGARGKAPAPSDRARDSVRVLSDFDETGLAKKVTVFADGLNIPSGVQPLPRKPGAKGDSVIVYSIPNIYRLEDTDGDGRADTREVLYGTADFLDTHGGMSSFLHWIDGWIYGTHGFRNHSEIRDKAGRLTILDSGNTYRFRPDGSAFEIYTHGQTNPFGLTVDPLGNFYTADSHSKPVYMLVRGGHYEGIGKQHDGLGFAPRITDDDHGSTAIAGIAYYAAEQFPEEFRGNLFNGNPVTRRINRDKLEWHGSTPKAIRQPDFLTCDDPWFRPVQVKLGPDGALYIADFYNPIIGHYEFPLADPRRDHSHGRIWRIVYRGEKLVPPPPDLSTLPAAGLVNKLADPNLTVRTLATNELVDRIGKDGASLLPSLFDHVATGELMEVKERWLKHPPPPKDWDPETLKVPVTVFQEPQVRMAHAAWALERLSLLPASLLNTICFEGEDSKHHKLAAEIQAAAHSILREREIWTTSELYQARNALGNSTPVAIRISAGALAAHPDVTAIQTIVDGLHRAGDDVQLRYAWRLALKAHLHLPGAYDKIRKMTEDHGFNTDVIDTSLAVVSPEAAEHLLLYLHRLKPGQIPAVEGIAYANAAEIPNLAEVARHVTRNLPPERFAALIPLVERINDIPFDQRLAIAGALDHASRQRSLKLQDALIAWIQRTMVDALATTDEAILKRAIESLRETKLNAKLDPLSKIAADPRRADPIRTLALEALANADGSAAVLATALADGTSLPLRKRAAELLGQSGGKDAETILLGSLPTAPGELAIAIAAGLATADDTCAGLLAAIEHGKAPPTLLRNTLVAAALEKRAQPLRDRAAALTKDLPAEDARLDQLIAARVTAFDPARHDAVRGALVFAQQCAICHQLKNTGANLGPALDGIGARGLQRLAEDILDPNRNVDPIFRQTIVKTTDGQTLAGLNAREEGELLVLTDTSGRPISFPKATVKSQTSSKLSLMPATFETAIPASDFNDLLVYLLATSND